MTWSHAIFRDSPIPQLVLERSGRIGVANPAAQALVGRHPLSGVALDDLVAAPDRPSTDAFIAGLAMLAPGEGRGLGPVTIDWHGTRRRVGLHGSVSQEGAEPPLLVLSLQALADPPASEAPEADAGDALTRVPDRRQGFAMLAEAVRPDATGCLIAIDLDAFEELNATLGFDAGDAVLTEVAARLRAAVPPGTHLARIDGDMFLAIVPGVPGLEVSALAGQLLASIVRPIEVGGTTRVVTASIGGATLAAADRDAALGAALGALDRAKRRGGGQVAIDSPHEPVWGRRTADIVAALREAEHRARVAEIEARTDPLTGLANNRRLNEDREALQAQARASGQWVGVAYLDLDRFKSLNDTRGHEAGDHALKAVATILQDQLRAEDCVYHKSGEEFVVLLTETDRHGALAAAERLRAAVEDARIPHQGSANQPVVTITGGVAAGRGSRLDLWRLTREADDALRLAKRMGRNRIGMMVGPPGEHGDIPTDEADGAGTEPGQLDDEVPDEPAQGQAGAHG
jgi:diguanylate cyclase (GGDEF)-like protein